jgi:hypothetical protein
MQWITALFSFLGAVLVAIVRIRSMQDGKKLEKLKIMGMENEALKSEIDRLNSKPATDRDRLRLFERAKLKAKAREDAKR